MSGAVSNALSETAVVRTEDSHGLQQLAEHSLLRLESHTASLDEIVREEIRRAFIAECGELVEQAHLAGEALAHLQRSARRHFGVLSLLTVILSVAGVLLLAGGWLPSPRESARLRAEQVRLTESIADLSKRGGQLQMRRCGPQGRLCVRVDLTAPSYGQAGDFLVLKGY
jgi:hypothetical protein